MPPNTVYVGRPSRWGNPITPSEYEPTWKAVVDAYRGYARMLHHAHPEWLEPLRGKNLACWCPLDAPCHADVLLELVGEPAPDTEVRLT
jgi:hypothetical protein